MRAVLFLFFQKVRIVYQLLYVPSSFSVIANDDLPWWIAALIFPMALSKVFSYPCSSLMYGGIL